MTILRHAFKLLPLFVFLLSFPAQAQEKFLDIQEIKSPGGIIVWLVEDHSLPIISLEFAFKGAGSALDPLDKQGLARIVSNTLDEGAGDMDSQTFQKRLTDHSITLSFGSGRDHFRGTLKTLSRHKNIAFDMLERALTSPRFDEDPLNRMKAANIMRIRSSLSDPGWIAARLMNDTAFAEHPYAMNSGGTLTTLPSITADDLRGFVKTRLTGDRLLVTVVGDITATELAPLMDRLFGALPPKSVFPVIPDLTVQNGGEIVFFEKDIPQTMIEIMQPGIGRNDPDYYTAQIMNFILGSAGFGSRLTEEIREKRGLTYGIHSGLMELVHMKGISLSTSTKNSNVPELLSLIRQEWQKMKQEQVTDEELADTKSYLIGSMPLMLSSTDGIARILLSLRLDGLPKEYLDNRAEKINQVTKEQIQQIAQKLLRPDQLTTILVGKPGGVTPTRVVTTLPHVE